MKLTVHPCNKLSGEVTLPPDKSLAHRSAMIASIASGKSRIRNYPSAADPQSTLNCLRGLGIQIVEEGSEIEVSGFGLRGLRAPSQPLDCGNSGTTMRLLSGILAGQPFDSVLIGDQYLTKRPMKRVADPLELMGAYVKLDEKFPPIRINGKSPLKAITYQTPVASAQIKSCVLLAGLFADDDTVVIESALSRDHTERMLGVDSRPKNGMWYHRIKPGIDPYSLDWTVPGDISAAGFFQVAAGIVTDSDFKLSNAGLNPSRTGLDDVLRSMGLKQNIENERTEQGEPVGDLVLAGSRLENGEIEGDIIPRLIDEIPVLAAAAVYSKGSMRIRNAEELRVKETDRLKAVATNFRLAGLELEEHEDGLTIPGGQTPKSCKVDAFGDHRIAMTMGILALGASGPITITGAEHVEISFPDYWTELEKLGVRIERE